MEEVEDQPDLNTWFSKSVCPQNKIVRFLCCNQKCANSALMCGQTQCQCMLEDHLRCSFVLADILIKDISTKRLSSSNKESQVLDSIIDLYNEMIEILSKDRQRLLQMRQNLGLNLQELRLFNALKKEKGEGIHGVLISNIYQNLQKTQYLQQLKEPLKEDLRKNINKQFQNIFTKIRLSCLKQENKPEKMLINFDKKTLVSEYFEYDEDQKILQRKDDKATFQIVSKQKLSQSMTCFFEVELLESQGHIATGIVTQKICKEKSGYKSEDSIKLFSDGGLWMDGKGVKKNFLISDRQVVRTIVDRQLNQVQWKIGSKTLVKVPIPEYFRSQPIYFSVQFDHKGRKCRLV